ncbi:ABC transporter substrate-binding protein [Parvibium lacunae]|uniref:ABC transporter substrate-binding protein n=2 Tax=Parvibium lacunae TaxID=1888893 RepID=A0A368L3B9_9BURK|nr:ABC transporter substrate-binding protein [Parvibium lacunae]
MPKALVMLGLSLLLGASFAQAQDKPDELVKTWSTEILNAIKADTELQSGNIKKLSELVDSKIMPNVNFQRTTALAVGRSWSKATPEQQKIIMQEFRTLLVRTYAGALTTVKDKNLQFKPLRAAPEDTEVVVRSQVVSNKGGEPIQLDYRLEKTANSWKIFDLNVLGIWLVENYRGQFASEINQNGLDGLIAKLQEQNKQASKK